MAYEKAAHLYDLFDTEENIEFFLRYASEAGEESKHPLTSVLSPTGRGEDNPPLPPLWRDLRLNPPRRVFDSHGGRGEPGGHRLRGVEVNV